MNRISAPRAARLVVIAVCFFACTSTYTAAELDAKEPIAEADLVAPLCGGLYNQPGCEMDNPVCTDPEDDLCDLP